jgi:hypothetical protein
VTISRKLVKARQHYLCERGRCDIERGDVYVRLYGCADRPDPPYVIRLCTACGADEIAKIRALAP